MGFLIFALILIIVICLILAVYYYKESFETKDKLNNYSFRADQIRGLRVRDVLDDLEAAMDKFLQQTFDITIEETFYDLQVDNPQVLRNNIEISETRKDVILADCYDKFMKYISDDFKNRLSLVYKKEEIDNVILDMMYHKITIYVFQRNNYQKNI